MLEKANNINAIDLDLIPIVDEPDEIMQIINEFYAEKGTLGFKYRMDQR
jgi:hypothetical protein